MSRRSGRFAAAAAAAATLAVFAALSAPGLVGAARADNPPTRVDAPAIPAEVAKLYDDKPVIELVTMGVGALIWERHGHIALCVREADPRQDRCYNYGIGDFGHPLDMTWGFFRATGAFYVAKMSRRAMLSTYVYADRTIWVQPLPLTQDQKKQILDKLDHDILPENRNYAYDHFLDNCTTRVRDVIDHATGGALSSMTDPPGTQTFRDYAREGFFGLTFGGIEVPLLVTDAAMGRTTDRIPSYYERMFLPQYLREAVAKRFGIQPIAIYTRRGEPASTDDASGRPWLALIILLLTAPAWITRLAGRLRRTGLAIAVIPYVLLGIILTFMAIISPIGYLRWNEVCLVLFPFDLLLLFLPEARRRRYARGRLIMLAVILLLSLIGILKQPLFTFLLWPAIPLAIAGLPPERQRAIRASRAGKLGEAAAIVPAATAAPAEAAVHDDGPTKRERPGATYDDGDPTKREKPAAKPAEPPKAGYDESGPTKREKPAPKPAEPPKAGYDEGGPTKREKPNVKKPASPAKPSYDEGGPTKREKPPIAK